MGILNVTPNSFSDGGLYMEPTAALLRAEVMVAEGARIIDVGGESAGPGAARVNENEEWKRVEPVLELVGKELSESPVTISIDTRRSEIARRAFDLGVSMVNCSGALDFDNRVATLVAEYGTSIVLFDLPVDPPSMRLTRPMVGDRLRDIYRHLELRSADCMRAGVPRESIYIDPGLGYPHSPAHNISLLVRLSEFTQLGFPIVIGPSRKQHLGQLMQTVLGLESLPQPTERLEAGLAEIALAVAGGASIIRTHDVRQARDFLAVWETALKVRRNYEDGAN